MSCHPLCVIQCGVATAAITRVCNILDPFFLSLAGHPGHVTTYLLTLSSCF